MEDQNVKIDKIDKILLIIENINGKIETLERNTEYIMNIIRIPFNWTYDKINIIRNGNASTINDQD